MNAEEANEVLRKFAEERFPNWERVVVVAYDASGKMLGHVTACAHSSEVEQPAPLLPR
jgi:hypothetical protein